MHDTKNVKVGSIWQHAKGGVYQVCVNCTIEETDTPAVMYKSLNVVSRDDFWVRPLDNFLERFEPVDLTAVDIAEILKQKHAA